MTMISLSHLTSLNPDTKNWITQIYFDSKGRILFGSDGYGLIIFDNDKISYLNTNDGLPSNFVHAIEEDKNQKLWIGTRNPNNDHFSVNKDLSRGGVAIFQNDKIHHLSQKFSFLENEDVYSIYKDNIGGMWISSTQNGVYNYADDHLDNFQLTVHLNDDSLAVQTILQDNKGSIWFGGSGGLYRFENNKMQVLYMDGNWHQVNH